MNGYRVLLVDMEFHYMIGTCSVLNTENVLLAVPLRKQPLQTGIKVLIEFLMANTIAPLFKQTFIRLSISTKKQLTSIY